MDELRGFLNAFPHSAVAFEIQPVPEATRVLVANERLEIVLGYTAAEAARFSLQHFLVLEDIPQLEEGLRRLAGGGSVYLDAVKLRSKAGLPIEGRMTLSSTTWIDNPLGLCFLEDIGTCRKTLAALERPKLEKPKEDSSDSGIFEYTSLVLLHADIRKVDSDFYSRLKLSLEKCALVEARLTRVQSGALLKEPSQNPHVKATVDLLNMFSSKMTIPQGKRVVLRCAQEGGKWMELVELVRDGNRFKPRVASHSAREAS